MAVFPEVDIPGSYDIASAIVTLDSFDSMHQTAERTSDLYSVGHAVIQAAIAPYINDDRVSEAILQGVSAYEVFGSIVQSHDALMHYRRGDVITMCQGSEGMLDTLSVFDDAYAELATAPELTEALRLLASNNVQGSPELVERAVQGAAVLRKIQLELDMLTEFRQEIEQVIS